MNDQILTDLARKLGPELPDILQRVRFVLQEERFRDMCSEYEDGVKSLRRLRESQHRRVMEVKQLIENLEREILHYLQEHERSPQSLD